MQLKPTQQAFRVALIYVIVSVVWILFTDEMVKRFISDPDTRVYVSIIKGWGFVILTGVLLYQILKRLLAKRDLEVKERQQAETALRESERLLRTVMDLVPHFIFAKDSQSRHLFVNQACAAANGMTVGQMIGKCDLDFVPDRAQAEAYMQDDREVMASGQRKFIAEERMTDAAGKVRILQTIKIPFAMPGAGGPALVGVAVDITDLKQAEAAQQESQRKLEAALASMTDAVFISDADGNFIEFNEAFATFHRFKNKAECARKLSDYPKIIDVITTDGELLPLHEWSVPRSLRGESAANVEYNLRRKDTGETWTGSYSFSPIRDPAGVIVGSVVVARDVTERNQVMNRLKETTGQLLEAQHIAGLGSYALEVKTGLWTSSEVLDDIFGIAEPGFRKDVTGWLQIVHPEERAEMRRYFQEEVLQGRAVFDRTYRIVRLNDQQERWVHGRGKLVLDQQGQIVCMMGIIQDITDRKRAEAALRESESLLRSIMDNSKDIIFVKDRECRFVFMNPAGCRLNGLTPAQLVGRTKIDFHSDPAEAARVQADDRRVMASGRMETIEEEFSAADGTRHVFLTTKVARRDSEGKIIGLIGVAHDITDRKQAEAALRQSESKYRRIFENVQDIFYQTDNDGRIIEISPSIERYSGFRREELIGRPVEEVYHHPEDRAKLLKIIREKGEIADYELRLKTKDGRLIHTSVNAHLLIGSEGKPVGIEGSLRDITGRKCAEEHVNLQFSALTAAANAIVITDHNGRIEWVNPAFTRITGYSAAEATGGYPRMLKSGEHPPEFYADMWTTIKTGNVWHGELVNKHKDGRHYNEDMTITPVRGADGQIAHFVAIKQDVTERRTLENQLRQAQKMEAIGTLAGGIAHDFNNILAAMFGYGYLLQEDLADNPAAQEGIAEILKAASRAKDLVQQILTFSRQREHKRQVIPLDTIVKEAMKFLRASLPANIKIEMDLGTDVPAILADATQIYQITINLATNALHAMEGRSGRLAVRLEAFQPDETFILAHPEFRPIQYARLTMDDTGHGMDAKTLERIFEPFFTTKPVGKGTGLGLSVVHGIVKSHDGIVTVQSEVGRGTTFQLYFPARTPDANFTEIAPDNIPRGQGQRILLVDDEAPLVAMFQRLLLRLNYQVTSCSSAREAMAFFQSDPAKFDLVITDLTMQETNGLELARQIRAIRPELPVILSSGFIANLNREDLRQAGICGLIEKPASMTALAEVTQRALAKPPAGG